MLPEPLAYVAERKSLTAPETVARNGCPRDTRSGATLGELTVIVAREMRVFRW